MNNRQRRKAKHRKREQKGERQRDPCSGGPYRDARLSEVELVRQGVLFAAEASMAQPGEGFSRTFDRLCWTRERVGFGSLDGAVTWWVDLATDRLWNEGWQAHELMARHAIDTAMLERIGGRPSSRSPD